LLIIGPAPGPALFPKKSRACRGANAALSEDRFQQGQPQRD